MSSGLDSFHKILKDENRRKIILLLHEKKSIGYVELMKALEITSTGKMNYHLKILSDLVSKNEAGHYTLTERGVLASRLLLEFPEQNRQQLGLKPKWWRRFWIETAFFVVCVVVFVLSAYLLGYTDLNGVQKGITEMVSAIAMTYMITHILREVLSRRGQLAVAKSVYILGGAWLVFVIAFLGVGFLLRGLSELLDMRLLGLFWNVGYMLFCFVVAPIIGAFIGYWFGKRRRFRTGNYNPDA